MPARFSATPLQISSVTTTVFAAVEADRVMASISGLSITAAIDFIQ